MVDPDMQALVLEYGSGMTKIGFSGDDAPRAVFPTIIGRPRNPEIMIGFVGDEAQAKRDLLKLEHPVEGGCVTNWNDWEKILHHSFYSELRVTPEEHPVLLCVRGGGAKNNIEKMCSILFETFNVPAAYFVPKPYLSMYASGRTTGCVLSMGAGITSAMPIYEGYMVGLACSSKIAGKTVTEYLNKIMSDVDFEKSASVRNEIIRDIKEKLCYVSLDYEAELTKAETSDHCASEYEFKLLDGKYVKIPVVSERFRAPEVLFKPSLIGSQRKGCHEVLFDTIQLCELEVRKDLYQNIVLAGGSTMFEGIVERIDDEIQKRASKNSKVKVNAPAERKFSSWIGGGILSCLSSFQNRWICKDEYDDVGSSVVYKKCPFPTYSMTNKMSYYNIKGERKVFFTNSSEDMLKSKDNKEDERMNLEVQKLEKLVDERKLEHDLNFRTMKTKFRTEERKLDKNIADIKKQIEIAKKELNVLQHSPQVQQQQQQVQQRPFTPPRSVPVVANNENENAVQYQQFTANEKVVKFLMEAGESREQVVNALRTTNNDVAKAMNLLFENGQSKKPSTVTTTSSRQSKPNHPQTHGVKKKKYQVQSFKYNTSILVRSPNGGYLSLNKNYAVEKNPLVTSSTKCSWMYNMDGFFRVNANMNLVLSFRSGTNNDVVFLEKMDKTKKNQRWVIQSKKNESLVIKPTYFPRMCLDDRNGKAILRVFYNTDDANQTWIIK